MKDEIKEILLKDFNEILVKEFCTDWKEKRLYIELFSNLLDFLTNLQQEKEDYKSRNEKAIEYIKEKARNNCWIDQYEANDLIKILNGGDKDVKD